MKIAQIFLTLAALCYTVIPPIVDFSPSHAFHPEWTGHARFHMVWLVITNSLLGLLALYLIWRRGRQGGLFIAAFISAFVLGGFFISALIMPVYDGVLSEPGGVAPGPGGLDANLVLFTGAFILNLIGLVAAKMRRNV